MITKYRGTIYSITIYYTQKSSYSVIVFVLLALSSLSHHGICHRHGIVVVFIPLASSSSCHRHHHRHLTVAFAMGMASSLSLSCWCHRCHLRCCAGAGVGAVMVVQVLVPLLLLCRRHGCVVNAVAGYCNMHVWVQGLSPLSLTLVVACVCSFVHLCVRLWYCVLVDSFNYN